MPGTPDQSSLAVIRDVSLQFWKKGSEWPGGGGATMVRTMEAAAVRPCASEMDTGSVFSPIAVNDGGKYCNEKT